MVLLFLNPKYSWAKHVPTLPTCRHREASTKLYPEHIRIPYPVQSSQGHSPLPALRRPGSCSSMDVRALSRWSHLLGQSKDPALLSLSWILIQSILELVALKPFFSGIPSHFFFFLPLALLSWGQASHILGPFAFLLPPDSSA